MRWYSLMRTTMIDSDYSGIIGLLRSVTIVDGSWKMRKVSSNILKASQILPFQQGQFFPTCRWFGNMFGIGIFKYFLHQAPVIQNLNVPVAYSSPLWKNGIRINNCQTGLLWCFWAWRSCNLHIVLEELKFVALPSSGNECLPTESKHGANKQNKHSWHSHCNGTLVVKLDP